jgi:hypothetical protein
MDSPKRITNRKSGSQSVTPPTDLKFSSDSRLPSWKTRTSTPYAAPTESRLSTIALIGMTIERKVRSSRRKASPSTYAKTIGARAFIVSLKSLEPAVHPVTFASAPGTLPIVAGMTSLRSVSSARFDFASVPLPVSGTNTRAACFDALASTLIGSCIWPVASAARLRAAMPRATSGRVTSFAVTTTTAGPAPPGNVAWTRS